MKVMDINSQRIMSQQSDNEYISEDGWTMYRHKYSGRWILMDETGKFIEVNTYRNDIASKYNLKLERKNNA